MKKRQSSRQKKLTEEYWFKKLKGQQSDIFFGLDDTVGIPSVTGLKESYEIPAFIYQQLNDVAVNANNETKNSYALGRVDQSVFFIAALKISLNWFAQSQSPALQTQYQRLHSDTGVVVPVYAFTDTGLDLDQSVSELIQCVQQEILNVPECDQDTMAAIINKYALLELGEPSSLFQCACCFGDSPPLDSILFRSRIVFHFDTNSMLHVHIHPDLSNHSLVLLLVETLLDILGSIVIASKSGYTTSLRYVRQPSASLQKKILDVSYTPTTLDIPKGVGKGGEASTLVELFKEQVSADPHRIGLKYLDKQLSYQDIDRMVACLVNHIHQLQPLQPEDAVAVIMDKSDYMIFGILAALSSGASYVPVATEFPRDRIINIVLDKPCKLILTDKANYKFVQSLNLSVPVLEVDSPACSGTEQYSNSLLDDGVHSCSGNDAAIILYTSGSTGEPQGIVLEHQQLVNKVRTVREHFNFDESLTCLLCAFTGSDAAVYQIFITLCSGGTLVVLDEEIKNDPGQFWQQIDSHNINLLNCIPSFLAAMLESVYVKRPKIKHLFVGGDILTSKLVQLISEKLTVDFLVNLYGPTEITIEATMFELDMRVTDSINNLAFVPIGRPSPSYQVLILSEQRELLPIGIVGELYIGGAGLARGYLNNQPLTELHFVEHPFSQGALMYKTGDLARFRADGNIEFLGRVDHQVKIRGHRVEISEVENLLMELAQVKLAVVRGVMDEAGNNQLVAYLECSNGSDDAARSMDSNNIDTGVLIAYLTDCLPTYMVPTTFVVLENIPLTTNGKVDRKRLGEQLPAPTQRPVESPKTPQEQRILVIWQELIGRQDIGVDDNFFAIGGHSLKAMQLVSRLYSQLGLNVRLRDVFEYPTISAFAGQYRIENRGSYINITVSEERAYYGLSHAQLRVWVASQLHPVEFKQFNMPVAFHLYGDVDKDKMQSALNKIIDHYDILRTAFFMQDGRPVQKVVDCPQKTIRMVDISDQESHQQALNTILVDLANHPFDLSKAPLIEAVLIKLTAEKTMLAMVLHHIVSDAWSMKILVEQLFITYENICHGYSDELPRISIQYKDYVAWERALLDMTSGDKLRAYWQNKLSAPLPKLKLMPDMHAAIGSENKELVRTIPISLTEKLEEMCREDCSTLFIGIITLLKILLHNDTGQKDIILGTISANRPNMELETQVGIFLNVLPVRSKIEGGDTLRQFLHRVRDNVLDAHDHQLYPLDCILSDVRNDFSGGGSNGGDPGIFKIMVNDLTGIDQYDFKQCKSLDIKPIMLPDDSNDYLMIFELVKDEGSHSLKVKFDSHLFLDMTIEKMLDDYLQLMATAVEDFDQDIRGMSSGENVFSSNAFQREEDGFVFN